MTGNMAKDICGSRLVFRTSAVVLVRRLARG
jgi:hypothetical protein